MNIDSIIIDEPEKCWLWGGRIRSDGYARARHNGKKTYAHRFVYELVNEPIPDGLTIDHLCEVRHCQNPSHMEAVQLHVNQERGRPEVCRKCGGEYEAPPSHWRGEHGRFCRPCRREYHRDYYRNVTRPRLVAEGKLRS